MNVSKVELIAQSYATNWHSTQTRKYTHEPYIEHPREVVEILRGVPGCTPEMFAAGWLHDTIEDAPDDMAREYRKTVIHATCGHVVLTMVLGLTDVSKPSDGNRAVRKRIDRLHAATTDPATKTVKLADIISNSQSILTHDPEFARVYLPEKRLLLDEALLQGDPLLWEHADRILREGLAHLVIAS